MVHARIALVSVPPQSDLKVDLMGGGIPWDNSGGDVCILGSTMCSLSVPQHWMSIVWIV